MREIKFRAWDTEKKTMFPVFAINFRDRLLATTPKYPFDWHSYIDMDNKHGWHVILMQYTGLKDKNGKEIYEGDIVLVDDDGECFPEEYNEKTEEYEPTGKYEVYYDNESLGFCLRNCPEIEYNPFTGPASFEVVGNIYENPDLFT